jgi:hypothetical protein
VIGLGAGALAAYSRPGDRYTFYEIDPVVVRIAEDERLFTFLADADGEIETIEGDGRLRLAEASSKAYDIIVLDAFSSDAVPAHLLTREALGLYLDKLADDGVLLFHVTNTYLDVRAVVAGAVHDHNLAGAARADTEEAGARPGDKRASEWVVAARDSATLAPLARDRWVPLERVPRVLWTDDFSDIISVVR